MSEREEREFRSAEIEKLRQEIARLKIKAGEVDSGGEKDKPVKSENFIKPPLGGGFGVSF